MSIGVQLNKGFLPKTLCFLFSGKAGVGKSFHAQVMSNILKESGYSSTRDSFAMGVKRAATSMGWDGKKDQKGRRLLQDVGQTGRRYDEDMWVRETFGRLEDAEEYPFDVVIIDDCRFRNEIAYVQKYEQLYECIPVRISAPEREILKGTPEYNEISELDLDDYKFLDSVVNEVGGDVSPYINQLLLKYGIKL